MILFIAIKFCYFYWIVGLIYEGEEDIGKDRFPFSWE